MYYTRWNKRISLFREIVRLSWRQSFLHRICTKEMTYWRTENVIKTSIDSTNPETILRKPPEKKKIIMLGQLPRKDRSLGDALQYDNEKCICQLEQA